MKIHINVLGAAISAMLVMTAAGCTGSGQQFAIDYNPAIEFSQYRTFALVSPPDSGSEELIDDRVRRAVVAQLVAKGLTRSDRREAALFVGYGVVDHTRHAGYGAPWGWGPEWGWRAYQWGVAWPIYLADPLETYTDGTVVIHLVDARTHRVVWHGRAAHVLRFPVTDADQATRRINAAVAGMLAKYPPRPPV